MNDEKTQTQAILCSSCEGNLEIDESKDFVECPYCGTKYSTADLLKESDAVRVEKIKSETYKEVEANKIKREIEREKNQEERNSIAAFKRGKFSKVLIGFSIFGVLMCMQGFRNGKFMAGIVAVITTASFMISWLMGMGIVKEPKKEARILLAILAFVLIVPYFSLYSSTSRTVEEFLWSDIELGEIIPEPMSTEGEIVSNSKSSLSLIVDYISKSDYKDYIKECEELGFTVESEETELGYSAYNKEGYKLNLWYTESDETLHISLDAPLQMSELKWPNSDIAKLIPVPKSTIGVIKREESKGFLIMVGNTPIEDFVAYADECSDSGFNINYEKGDKFYRAEDINGNKISLSYEGNNIMKIEATATETAPETPIEKDNADINADTNADTASAENLSTESFVLVNGEAGEYGKTKTYNKGTEFESSFYAYYVPEGKYKVRNVGKNITQISVYSDEVHKNENGWEEAAESFGVAVLGVNESATLSVGSGQFVKISGNDNKIEFEKELTDSNKAAEPAKKEEKSEKSANEISPEFKASMDSYEKFFDEYVAFMKKYNNSSSVDSKLLADYSNYLQKYSDMMSKFEALGKGNLSSAELEYYTEVNLRISEKLLEVYE